MHISRELIEKYHDGKCSPEEREAVENWLLNDEPEDELTLPAGENKAQIEAEMWHEIASVLPEKQKENQYFFKPFWRQAAAVILLALTGSVLYSLKNQDIKPGVIVINNASDTLNKDLHEQEYSISIGPNSNVEINNETGKLNFCGALMINPKKDIELTIQGTCAKPGEKSERMTLKKGQNYIALNYGNTLTTNEVIILPQGSMTGLPPMVQRQLMIQFNI